MSNWNRNLRTSLSCVYHMWHNPSVKIVCLCQIETAIWQDPFAMCLSNMTETLKSNQISLSKWDIDLTGALHRPPSPPFLCQIWQKTFWQSYISLSNWVINLTGPLHQPRMGSSTACRKQLASTLLPDNDSPINERSQNIAIFLYGVEIQC